MEQRKELYNGKAKTIYATDDPDFVIMHFRDDTSAFDGEKISSLSQKGKVNNHFSAFIMQRLEENGIATHFQKLLNDQDSLVDHLDMIPIECVIRNITAGSICKRLGIEEGISLEFPTFEFFLKNDELHDPMVNEHHIKSFNWATPEDVALMKTLSFKINEILQPLFYEADMLLVDYKLEFGRYKGALLLGDEFTPDGCRIWDKETREKLDKDRFRRDLGDVVESYQIAARRLGISTDQK